MGGDGIKVVVAGRVNGAEIARTEHSRKVVLHFTHSVLISIIITQKLTLLTVVSV
jgi:ribosomal protein S3